jgi:thiosulfate/3-mercaptopyruvate sulfurtransferase
MSTKPFVSPFWALAPGAAALCAALAAAAPAAAQGLLVTPAQLAAEAKEPAVVILHVADRSSDFEAGHIPGARFVGYNQIAVSGPDNLQSELPPVDTLRTVFEGAGVTNAARVVVYGTPIAATRAFFTLDYLGHPNVRVLNGGLAAWKAEGKPVEAGSAAVGRPGSFTPKPKPEVVAMADWIRTRLESPQMALIDARPDPEYTGSDGGMNGMHPVGHLPGAKQLVWTDVVSRTGQFIPEAEMRAKFQAAGAKTGMPVVTYCMVGMRASVIYFAARHLGFDAKMYDGSIIDWGNRKLPTRPGRQ